MRWGGYEIRERTPTAGGGFDAIASLGDRTVWLWAGAEGRGSAEQAADVAERLSRVYQANLPRVLGGDFVEGRAVLRMTPVVGRLLPERLEEGRPAALESLDVIQSVGAALVKLHRAGIVHGAVDAGEIFLPTDGPVLLLHGGMMPFLEPRAPRSPEDRGTEARDEASDVFGLARLLARLTTGVDAFETGDGEVDEERLPQELPEGFRRFLARSLARAPSSRIRRAEEFTADLRVIRASWVAPDTAAASRPRWLPGLGAGAVILVAAMIAWSRGCAP